MDRLKHAYLILAHNEFDVLQKLVHCLDDKRNDIYIHFDQKVAQLPELSTQHAQLCVLHARVDVHWGDVSVVAAEYRLFETAAAQQQYAYYHVLSGVDLPLKSQDEIHAFFAAHQGQEFIGFQKGNCDKEIDRKVRRIHFYPNRFRAGKGLSAYWYRAARAFSLRFQGLFGLYRNQDVIFKKGTQWVSVTDAFVRYLLTHKSAVLKMYQHTFCSDEIFIQTLCWNSRFRLKRHHTNSEYHDCQRMIGWHKGELTEWTSADFDRLIASDLLFARKFSAKNMELVDRMVERVCGKQTSNSTVIQ
ncbi:MULTISPECIES: beta-1,6-N-acetylglucosaminyltransferase [unclassified Sphingobacterium]|uniref:beta-1,6-N-acetylglucosaminyltransferase n=1 Tax=unclassified Sphingobacterium TaxID=2609468 RepID=UPI0025E8DC3E|nr:MULTISPECIES: beta-1,6-N-acetylglucosaminyltransferase [unclassified Sphingobacterium]